MKNLKRYIVGNRIANVQYSNVDSKEGHISEQFDCIDYGINFKMEDGFEWHINFKEHEAFEMDTGEFLYNSINDTEIVNFTDVTNDWDHYILNEIVFFNAEYLKKGTTFLTRCEIKFITGRTIEIYVAEEMGFEKNLPEPLEFGYFNEIYVLFNQPKPKWIRPKVVHLFQQNLVELFPASELPKSNLAGFIIVVVILTFSAIWSFFIKDY